MPNATNIAPTNKVESKEARKLAAFFTAEDAKPPVMQEQAEAMRLKIRKTLQDAQQRAQDSGKPLLIVVGENHVSRESALLMSMVYTESRAIGIRDVALELPYLGGRGEQLINRTLAQHNPAVSRRNLMGLTYAALLAESNGDSIHLVDDRFREAFDDAGRPRADLALDRRNEAIAANLTRIPRSTMMLTGALHLKGIDQLMARHGTHEVVMFDTFVQTVYDYNTPAAAQKLSLSGDSRKLDMATLLRLGLGETEAQRFSEWAEREGHMLSADTIHKTIARLVEASKTQRLSPKELDRLSVAFYETGEDRVSAKLHKKLLTTQPLSGGNGSLPSFEAALLGPTELRFGLTSDFSLLVQNHLNGDSPATVVRTSPKVITAPARSAIYFDERAAPSNSGNPVVMRSTLRTHNIETPSIFEKFTDYACDILNETLGSYSPCRTPKPDKMHPQNKSKSNVPAKSAH